MLRERSGCRGRAVTFAIRRLPSQSAFSKEFTLVSDSEKFRVADVGSRNVISTIVRLKFVTLSSIL